MLRSFQLFPEAASTGAVDVDRLYIFLIAVTGSAVVLVMSLAIFFAVKYRRTADNQVPKYEVENKYLEYSWIVLPFIAFMVIYFWSAQVYFRANRSPDDALEVWGTGRRWMWKFQHLGGQSEINELHVPLGRPVKVILASEDVIHSFFVPAFRVKRDVLPHRYTTVWFRPTKAGRYHLFCAEYCGTEHSKMIGSRRGASGSGVPDVARGRKGGLAGRGGGAALLGARVQHVPRGRRARRARPAARGRLRDPGAPQDRPDGDGRRELPARVDSEPGRRRWSPATSRSCLRSRGRSTSSS